MTNVIIPQETLQPMDGRDEPEGIDYVEQDGFELERYDGTVDVYLPVRFTNVAGQEDIGQVHVRVQDGEVTVEVPGTERCYYNHEE